jgi:hypothetical protein
MVFNICWCACYVLHSQQVRHDVIEGGNQRARCTTRAAVCHECRTAAFWRTSSPSKADESCLHSIASQQLLRNNIADNYTSDIMQASGAGPMFLGDAQHRFLYIQYSCARVYSSMPLSEAKRL